MVKRSVFMSGLVFLLLLMMDDGVLNADRLVNNHDGTVTDSKLNLMWATTDNQGDIDWHQAQRWVRATLSLTLPKNYDDWRLPTAAELESLVDRRSGYETDCGQKAFIKPPIRLSCGWLWTSETDTVAPIARIFNFDHVYHYTVRKAQRRGYRVLAVRDLE